MFERTVVHTSRCTFGWSNAHLAPERTGAPTSSARDAPRRRRRWDVCSELHAAGQCRRAIALRLSLGAAFALLSSEDLAPVTMDQPKPDHVEHALDASRTAGVDVNRPLRIASTEVATDTNANAFSMARKAFSCKSPCRPAGYAWAQEGAALGECPAGDPLISRISPSRH